MRNGAARSQTSIHMGCWQCRPWVNLLHHNVGPSDLLRDISSFILCAPDMVIINLQVNVFSCLLLRLRSSSRNKYLVQCLNLCSLQNLTPGRLIFMTLNCVHLQGSSSFKCIKFEERQYKFSIKYGFFCFKYGFFFCT